MKHCYFNKLEFCKCDLVYPSFDFLLNAGIFCWINPSIFFFTPGPTFDLLGDICQYFSLLPVSQKMCSRWRLGSIPPRVLNPLTFSHAASARLYTEVHLRQQS